MAIRKRYSKKQVLAEIEQWRKTFDVAVKDKLSVKFNIENITDEVHKAHAQQEQRNHNLLVQFLIGRVSAAMLLYTYIDENW